MSEKNERPKPPTRRTGGRALGGAKKTTPPPTPPAAELTPEQFAAEEAAAEGEGRPTPSTPRVPPAPSSAPIETSAQAGTETVSDATHNAASGTAAAAPINSAQEPAPSQPVHSVVTSQEGVESAGEPPERQAPPAVPATGPAAPAVHPAQQAQPLEPGSSHIASSPSSTGPSAEVAVRPSVPPMAGSSAFPVRTDSPNPHQEQHARAHEAPSEGAPYAHGPGRPKDIPDLAALLNQRIITRESLDSSVPAALKLKKRLKRFALDNELDHLPIGDIVSVALDEWLTARGF
ncbi:hypothetical protein GCM10011579_089330 [Streptomyces albiflavescens]|uniref:Uncharacterized protein n=2 Tax=Actinomycetota TaxID=201174 RepID=A0A917YET8_9ACTN|nr:hypothetical protein GCM10011579_089330 [Streptomyces albiflavescens]